MTPTRNPKEPKDGEVAKVIVCKKKRNYSKVLPTRSNKKSTVRDRRYNMHKNMKALERDSGLGGISFFTLPHRSRSTIYLKCYGTIGKYLKRSVVVKLLRKIMHEEVEKFEKNRGKPNNEEKTVEQPLFIAPTEEELCTDAINAEVVNEAYFDYDQSKFGKQAEEASDSDSSDSEGGGLHVVRGRKVGSGANNDFMPGSSVDTESISVPPLMMSRVVNSGTTLLSPLVSEPNSRQLSTSGSLELAAPASQGIDAPTMCSKNTLICSPSMNGAVFASKSAPPKQYGRRRSLQPVQK